MGPPRQTEDPATSLDTSRPLLCRSSNLCPCATPRSLVLLMEFFAFNKSLCLTGSLAHPEVEKILRRFLVFLMEEDLVEEDLVEEGMMEEGTVEKKARWKKARWRRWHGGEEGTVEEGTKGTIRCKKARYRGRRHDTVKESTRYGRKRHDMVEVEEGTVEEGTKGTTRWKKTDTVEEDKVGKTAALGNSGGRAGPEYWMLTRFKGSARVFGHQRSDCWSTRCVWMGVGG
ncbi:MAG: hypothetical protein LQ341_000165 [Variospora aurantia]|nr:MAG: hypothetical protein LQ341_000165 [Variospora aurantia]